MKGRLLRAPHDGRLLRASRTTVGYACVLHDGRLLRASRTTVGYCVRPARRSATACVPHDGRLLRASRTTVGSRDIE